MLVAHDISEEATAELTGEIAEKKRPHPMLLQRLRSIRRFTLDDYHELDVRGVRVLVAKSLEAERPPPLLNRWLSVVPGDDLAGISRLYVVERTQDRYWGQYLQILSVVTLVWRRGASRRLGPRLATEFTLYHELGHHMHRNETLTTTASEQRADAYALDRLAVAHRALGRGFLGRLVASLALGRSL